MRLIQTTTRALRTRLADERGFSMITVSMALLVVMMASAAALGASSSDFGLGRDDVERKQAYAAAEAGIHDYLYHLNADNSYWAKCANVPEVAPGQPAPVNLKWNGSGADPRKWRSVPQPVGDPRTDKVQYAIELLPANGAAQCSTANAQGTMLDSATGTFRIRSTGRVQRPDGTWQKRSVVGQFRRRGFLDYLYFTDYETSDPAWYQLNALGRATSVGSPHPTAPDLVTWASQNCARYWREGRGNAVYDGYWYTGYSWQSMPDVRCTNIQFADGDKIRGPLHTNDDIYVCGSPDFGRTGLTSPDAIEVSAPPTGWRPACPFSNPTFNGPFKTSSPIVSMPPSNASLESQAGNYLYTGRTELQFDGNSVRVTNVAKGLNNTQLPIPPNGVIYVKNGDTGCSQGYTPLSNLYPTSTTCADVYVKGSYSNDVTIGSEKDIIIWGSLNKASDAYMLGLIANNFVRVYHPVTGLNTNNNPPTCSNDPIGTMQTVSIDAAILALKHSFTVDNYFCGSALQTLKVKGAIAQKYRGPVGRGSGTTVVNGYLKDYEYDDRLRLRQPPHFLDPIQSAWRMVRQWEQVPAR